MTEIQELIREMTSCIYHEGYFGDRLRFNQDQLEAINFMANQSFLNQIRRLRDLNPIEFERRVCINPMWFNGPRQEVLDSFDRLRRALGYDNQRLNELIDEVKRTRYVEEIVALTLQVERRRSEINVLVKGALIKLEMAGHWCDRLNCVCHGQFEGCPMRAQDYDSSDDDSDLEMNVSSDEGFDA